MYILFYKEKLPIVYWISKYQACCPRKYGGSITRTFNGRLSLFMSHPILSLLAQATRTSFYSNTEAPLRSCPGLNPLLFRCSILHFRRLGRQSKQRRQWEPKQSKGQSRLEDCSASPCTEEELSGQTSTNVNPAWPHL